MEEQADEAAQEVFSELERRRQGWAAPDVEYDGMFRDDLAWRELADAAPGAVVRCVPGHGEEEDTRPKTSVSNTTSRGPRGSTPDHRCWWQPLPSLHADEPASRKRGCV